LCTLLIWTRMVDKKQVAIRDNSNEYFLFPWNPKELEVDTAPVMPQYFDVCPLHVLQKGLVNLLPSGSDMERKDTLGLTIFQM
jgi:hypothetical protein